MTPKTDLEKKGKNSDPFDLPRLFASRDRSRDVFN